VIEAPFTPVYARKLRVIVIAIVMADNKVPSKPRDRGQEIGDLLSDFAEPLAGGNAFFERLGHLYASGGLDTGPAASALPRREGHG